jgi:hypothetical protein
MTPEQKAELDTLMALVPKPRTGFDLEAALGTWLGLPMDDIRLKLGALLGRKDQLEDALRTWVESNPFDSALAFLGVSALAFYQAEKGHNPRVDTLVDAFYYIATCASVGYADIFAMTQRGRAIASLVMIVGPSLAAKALDRPAR